MAREARSLRRGSLFTALPDATSEERVELLTGKPGLRIERIVSQGQSSPPGFWYDQPQDEWVAVLAGRARIEIEGEPQPVDLLPGDWLEIPAHLRHRVASTSSEETTIWLAVHG